MIAYQQFNPFTNHMAKDFDPRILFAHPVLKGVGDQVTIEISKKRFRHQYIRQAANIDLCLAPLNKLTKFTNNLCDHAKHCNRLSRNRHLTNARQAQKIFEQILHTLCGRVNLAERFPPEIVKNMTVMLL